MRGVAIKRPQLADGTGVNLRTLSAFVRQAHVALVQEGEEEAAHFFEMFRDYLEQDVVNGSPFIFTNKVLGL